MSYQIETGLKTFVGTEVTIHLFLLDETKKLSGTLIYDPDADTFTIDGETFKAVEIIYIRICSTAITVMM